MKVGDLVREQNRENTIEAAGIIISIDYPRTQERDYRTPTCVLVFYGTPQNDQGILKHEVWFHKKELVLINESR